jgi:hypothetical protein
LASNLGGRPVSVVSAGGAPYVRSTATNVPIATPVTDGKAPPITLVSAGAPPIRLVNDDGTEAA